MYSLNNTIQHQSKPLSTTLAFFSLNAAAPWIKQTFFYWPNLHDLVGDVLQSSAESGCPLEPPWAEVCYLIISIPQKLGCQETDEFICSYLWFIHNMVVLSCCCVTWAMYQQVRKPVFVIADSSMSQCCWHLVWSVITTPASLCCHTAACRFPNQISPSIIFLSLYFAKENLFKA